MFVRSLLSLEASGRRMRELLGLEKRKRFYHRVDYDPDQEPGWDVIYVRDAFRVVGSSCVDGTADRNLLDVDVEFPAGRWFDRETSGDIGPERHTYRVRQSAAGFKVVSRLPPPFVSSKGAVALLGSPPFDKPPLIQLKNELKRTIPR